MKKINSLILLINTLSKAEKKAIYLHSDLTKGEKVYMELFRLVDKQKIVDSTLLFEQFKQCFCEASFHPVVKYLYDFILAVLVKLKTSRDSEFVLYQKLLNAKILHERNLDADYYATLQQVKQEAKAISNYHILLMVRRMELNFLRTNGFKDVTESTLLHKQHKVNDTLKIIRQINEQSSLYELLLFRIEKESPTQIASQKQFFTDLVVSEISLVSNLSKDVFEIQKLHQLFQAHYLINVGDYKSALNSFKELDKLFSENKVHWNNPPLYYATVLEGILESLRGIGEYSQMEYFINRLQLLEHPSIPFQTEIACIKFIYTIIPDLDSGNAAACLNHIEAYKDSLISKIDLLTPFRYMQLSLYLSVIYLWNKKYSPARKQITRIINSDSYVGIWLFRLIQLINLMVHYELGDWEIITSRIRSIKRQNKIEKKNSKLEDLLFQFLNLDLNFMHIDKRAAFILKVQNEFELIASENNDRKLIALFDFKKWMLSHLDKGK